MIIVLKPHTTKDDVSRVENMVKKIKYYEEEMDV